MQQFIEQQKPLRVMGPGKVYFHYGPSSILVMADSGGEPLTELCCQAFEVIDASLKEIAASLDLLRLAPALIPEGRLTGLPLKMLEAVSATKEPTLTPMAAVAGTVADSVADWLFSQGATRAMVNNGGDIALRLAPGTSVKMGIASSLSAGTIDRAITIHAEDGIGGCATSGLGGRSLTRGVAQGVSAFSSRCALADALATQLANSSFVPSEQVQTKKAGEIAPDSDIKDLDVVVGVGKLNRKEVKQALKQIEQEAVRQKRRGNLIAMCARVQNRMLDFEMPRTS